jgi:hypothetical protein
MGKVKEELQRKVEQSEQDWFEFWDDYYYDGVGHPQEALSKSMCKRPSVSHYSKGAIQPIDYINSNNLNFNLGNCIKYITRCNYKGTKREDLLKAIDYINFELERGE